MRSQNSNTERSATGLLLKVFLLATVVFTCPALPQGVFSATNHNQHSLWAAFVSVEQIAFLSEHDVIATIPENDKTYAIGFIGKTLFKTEIWGRVSQAHGLYPPWTAASTLPRLLACHRSAEVGNQTPFKGERPGEPTKCG